MIGWFFDLPLWLQRGVSSLAVLGASCVLGFVLGWIVRHRVTTLVARTKAQWDDVVVGEVARRIPVWSLIVGTYLASGFWPLQPNVVNTLNKVLFASMVLSLTFCGAALITKLTALYASTLESALPVTSLTQNIARGMVVTMGLLVVLNGLGLSITPMLTALGVGGLAVALALQDTLANLFAGVYVTIAGQIRVGDYIRLDSGQEGYVADIGWRSTRIRMLPNNLVLVPNAKLSQAIVTNYYLPDRALAVLVEVGVDYDSDLDHVERVTRQVARETLGNVPGAAADFDPFIRYHTFSDSSINFTVILRAQEYVDQYLLKHEFIKRLHECYRHEGIVIPFPIRTLVHRDAALELPAGRA